MRRRGCAHRKTKVEGKKEIKMANSKNPMWPNLYGCQAVQHKLKKRVKMDIMYFYLFFEVMSDSLTAM